MQYRKFGNTSLRVSEIGFGAWGIGGPSMAGDIPIGWGSVDDGVSEKALAKALDLGVNFFDTADFYGLGHSESLLGKVLGNRKDVILASKLGHRLDTNGAIYTDYSAAHIIRSCEGSLRRLNREVIDYYQLHTAKVADLEKGECVEAMEKLRESGKIRYWGVSLNTFSPQAEAEYLFLHKMADGMQLVLNIMNQEALPIVEKSQKLGYGILARMPLQFGLLTGKFSKSTRFPKDDHRVFRLPPALLATALDTLESGVWHLCDKYGLSKTVLAMSFILSFEGVSSVIPGIKTPQQALENTQGIRLLAKEDLDYLCSLYPSPMKSLLGQ
ncbi:aldo/keto reductase [Cyclobacterium jeungdonense]|uniref:Aldo/keto reductase n=1 Tax=Cyclobacterium jeungdonense TaxID=708087 RepID=A0ABT8CA58_9BACT|nr:aldo/keto reductase [Cyclobacterium jeungdonense]MDN3689256.1 aldo/keto reductase [Cyclobacterium jeungdonense]